MPKASKRSFTNNTYADKQLKARQYEQSRVDAINYQNANLAINEQRRLDTQAQRDIANTRAATADARSTSEYNYLLEQRAAENDMSGIYSDAATTKDKTTGLRGTALDKAVADSKLDTYKSAVNQSKVANIQKGANELSVLQKQYDLEIAQGEYIPYILQTKEHKALKDRLADHKTGLEVAGKNYSKGIDAENKKNEALIRKANKVEKVGLSTSEYAASVQADLTQQYVARHGKEPNKAANTSINKRVKAKVDSRVVANNEVSKAQEELRIWKGKEETKHGFNLARDAARPVKGSVSALKNTAQVDNDITVLNRLESAFFDGYIWTDAEVAAYDRVVTADRQGELKDDFMWHTPVKK